MKPKQALLSRVLILTTALLAAQAAVAEKIATRQWVESLLATNAVLDRASVEAITEAASDNSDLFVSADGTPFIKSLERRPDGGWTNATHHLALTATNEVGTYRGAVVTDSSDPNFPAGMRFAIASYAERGGLDARCLRLVNRGTNLWYAQEADSSASNGTWTNAVAFVSEDNLPLDDWFGSPDAYRYLHSPATTGSLTVYTSTNGVSLAGPSFTIEPCHLLRRSWLALAGEATDAPHAAALARGCAFSDRAYRAESELRLTLAEIRAKTDEQGVPSALSLLRGLILQPARADDQPTTSALILPLAWRGPERGIVRWPTRDYAADVDLVSIVDEYGNSVRPTAENCDADPEFVYPRANWEDPANWLPEISRDNPLSVSIPVWDAESATWVSRTRRIRSLDTLLGLIASSYPDTRLIAQPWPGYTLTPVKTCRTTGAHVYGADCRCIACGHRREHDYGGASATRCARCQNEFDLYRTERGRFILLARGGSGEMCGATPSPDDTDCADLALHGGFRDETPPGDAPDPNFNCSCECGYYSLAANPLAHDWPEADESAIWSPTDADGNDDPEYHWRQVACSRCRTATRWTNEPHDLAVDETRREGDSDYLDDERHNAPGTCETCGRHGLTVEEHERDENCRCRWCDRIVHEYRQIACGPYSNAYCIHCQQAKNGSAIRHAGWYAFTAGDSRHDTMHHCLCGRAVGDHVFRNHACVDSSGDSEHCDNLTGGCGLNDQSGLVSHPCMWKSGDSSSHSGDRSTTFDGLDLPNGQSRPSVFNPASPDAPSPLPDALSPSVGTNDQSSAVHSQCPDCRGSLMRDFASLLGMRDFHNITNVLSGATWTLRTAENEEIGPEAFCAPNEVAATIASCNARFSAYADALKSASHEGDSLSLRLTIRFYGFVPSTESARFLGIPFYSVPSYAEILDGATYTLFYDGTVCVDTLGKPFISWK